MKKKIFSSLLVVLFTITAIGTFVSCKDYDDDISTNTNAITALQEQLTKLQTALDDAKKDAETAHANFATKQEAKDAAAEAAATAKAEAIQEAIDQCTELINGKASQEDLNNLATRVASIEETLNSLPKNIATVDDVNAAKENLQSQLDALEYLKEILPEGTTITDKFGDIEALKETINETVMNVDGKDVTGLKEIMTAINNKVNSFSADVNVIQYLVSKRLTSLVFAPDTYVDGIECIKFATLKYNDWGTDAKNWLADEAKKNADGKYNEYIIDDAEQLVEYLANPKNVKYEDIAKLEFVSNEATNTRAVSQTAPVAVASWNVGTNGVWQLNLTKTGKESFGTDRDNFTIVALKATLAESVMTDEEKAKGEVPVIYSDWARLYETSVTPYIHNAKKHDDADKLIENQEGSHFWSYSEAYNGKTTADELPTSFNDKHIAVEQYYGEPIDLKTLVEVCDKQGGVYNEEKYGLEYEFHLMDYTLKNEGSTEDATNQKNFAKLEGSKLTSQSRDGQLNNRNAIGRQPMIQVVLKDKKNNAVVDVRYFKVKWTDKNEVVTIDKPIKDFTDKYSCGNEYELKVLEEPMNTLYAKFNMSRDEFHNSFTLDNNLYAKAEDAGKKENPAATLGKIEDLTDATGAGQTHNLQWTINTADNKATQAEYKAGKKVITAYAVYTSKTNENLRVVFPLTLTLTIEKMALKVNKDQTMWSNGERFVNPQLESDANYGNTKFATTQILGSILQGYIDNGQTPGTIAGLVNYGTAKFVFDDTKLASADWTVSADGLTLFYKGTSAATIVGDKIQLTESNNGAEGSEPTEGALLLVGGKAPVKLVDSYCDLTDVIEAYNFSFITPLAFTSSYATITLQDITAGGSKSESLAGTFEIKEVFTTNKRVVWDNKEVDSKTDASLVKWYGVEAIKYDTDKAKTNIQLNGTIGSECNVALSSIKNSDGSKKYDVEIAGNKVTFYNKSGNAIGREFKIQVPVTVNTKWQKDMKATLTIVIKPSI